jgi:flagellar biosynthesis GTPase FlhF
MSNKVVVIFSDGSELPMQGPKTDEALKRPVEEQAKIFYDAATKSKQGQGKTPVTFGQEGKKPVPFSSVTKPQPSTPSTTTPSNPGAEPAPAKPEVKPTPNVTTPPVSAPTAPPDSRINDLAKEWEEKAKAKAREEQAAKEAAEAARKEKEAEASKSKQEADKKAKELEALRAQEAKAKAEAEAAAKAEAEKKNKPSTTPAREPAQSAPAKEPAREPAQSAPVAPAQSEPAKEPAQSAPAAPAQSAPAKPAQASTQPGKWDSLRKELGITGPSGTAKPSNQAGPAAQPGNAPGTAIQGTTSNTPGNKPGTQSGDGSGPGKQPARPDPAQIQSGGRLPGDGGWKDLGDGTQKWVGPSGIDTSKGPYTGQKIETGTIVRTPVWKGDDDLSRKYNQTDLEAIRADIRRQRRELDAQRNKLKEAALKGPKKK